ncbi:MAG TPA: DUF1549 and DUF1553 domain-containing protein [Planctomycetaceae bacterium]|nr:DUF1549 and DUF1553 domain-containing protein [Planctomycetaceae bacterium]
MTIFRPTLAILLSSALAPHFVSAGEDVSFRNDVMAVLSKSGCNMGVCHGNKNGKGGFKLSLRGEDPAFDFSVLTRDVSARRTNLLDPEQSLILLKPTMHVPHEGGRRFEAGSPEYEILRRWIAAGLPRDRDEAPRLARLDVTPLEQVLVEPQNETAIRALATWSDGTTTDVTRLAVCEASSQTVTVSGDGVVRREGFGETTLIVRFLDRQSAIRLAFIPERPGFTWNGPEPAGFIDEHVFAKLRRLRMNPSDLCDDSVFIRRAFLDLLGLIPTADEARQFVADSNPGKRARLVDELLERPEFAEFWALKWADLLRIEEKTLDRKGVQNFHAWIRTSIATGQPLDEFARELVAARGSTYASPASNYYRAMRDPLMRAESTAQVFLGIRLGCAKCHNHPFDRWTQDDYYGWASLFARVDYHVLENRRRDSNDKHEFDGEQIVYMPDSGEVTNPRTGAPQPPQFLGDGARGLDDGRDRLLQLADWIARRDNERFVKTQVNRVWFHLLGRGIVDPIDDFRATNPPSHPGLLDELARGFVEHGFDLRRLVRTIMNSRTYQLSAVPNETNRDDEANFSRALVRRMSAEQLLDSLTRVTGVPVEFSGYPVGMRAGQLPGVIAARRRDRPPQAGDQFLTLFGKPPRLQACECERSEESTLSQTFQLISGPLLHGMLSDAGNRLGGMSASASDEDAIVELYWTVLSRPPSEAECAAAVGLVQSAEERRTGLEDVAWALATSNEFVLRR